MYRWWADSIPSAYHFTIWIVTIVQKRSLISIWVGYIFSFGNQTWLAGKFPNWIEGLNMNIADFNGPFSSTPCLITRGYVKEKLYWKYVPVEIDSGCFPMKNAGSFHSWVIVYQRVCDIFRKDMSKRGTKSQTCALFEKKAVEKTGKKTMKIMKDNIFLSIFPWCFKIMLYTLWLFNIVMENPL